MHGSIQTYDDPNGLVQAPTGIIGAPDGDIWFTSIGNNRVGRVRVATGTIESFADPADAVRLPANIIPAVDGRLWFTCLGAGMLASIDPSAPDPAATITPHHHPELDRPVAIKTGPDGRLWVSLRGGEGAIASLDPAAPDPVATVQLHRSPTIAGPSALFAHPSGTIWWVNADAESIGRLDASGARSTITAFARERLPGTPRAWAIDGAGWLWVTVRDPAGVVGFDPTSDDPWVASRHATDPRLATPDGIWLGADDALWIADTDANQIARFDPVGQAWSFFGGPPLVQAPFDIKRGVGSDLLWFTNKDGNTIGSIDTGR
jgi:virginiamycin B lyase